jgi:elongator complex protein 2
VPQQQPPFRLGAHVPKAHTRVIWGVSITEDEKYLATCSRDGSVKIWGLTTTTGEEEEEEEEEEEGRSAIVACEIRPLTELPKFACGVSSVAWAPLEDSQGKALLAVGLESGKVELWSVDVRRDAESRREWVANEALRHSREVTRIQWCKGGSSGRDGRVGLLFATCGRDHAVRVMRLQLTTL